jgi:hypothetical protein
MKRRHILISLLIPKNGPLSTSRTSVVLVNRTSTMNVCSTGNTIVNEFLIAYVQKHSTYLGEEGNGTTVGDFVLVILQRGSMDPASGVV